MEGITQARITIFDHIHFKPHVWANTCYERSFEARDFALQSMFFNTSNRSTGDGFALLLSIYCLLANSQRNKVQKYHDTVSKYSHSTQQITGAESVVVDHGRALEIHKSPESSSYLYPQKLCVVRSGERMRDASLS